MPEFPALLEERRFDVRFELLEGAIVPTDESTVDSVVCDVE